MGCSLDGALISQTVSTACRRCHYHHVEHHPPPPLSPPQSCRASSIVSSWDGAIQNETPLEFPETSASAVTLPRDIPRTYLYCTYIWFSPKIRYEYAGVNFLFCPAKHLNQTPLFYPLPPCPPVTHTHQCWLAANSVCLVGLG